MYIYIYIYCIYTKCICIYIYIYIYIFYIYTYFIYFFNALLFHTYIEAATCGDSHAESELAVFVEEEGKKYQAQKAVMMPQWLLKIKDNLPPRQLNWQ